tara:strand:+ start:13101 stop:13859 length:759 start_codon:yes stop_codon:yes gene_type:complete
MADEKYTLQQYAAMQGGHEMPVDKEQYDFINTLGEARMFKTRQQIASAGADSITDHLFVTMMSLYMMSNDYEYAPVAKAYAGQTMRKGNFNTPSPSGSDVYQTMHTLLKPEGLINGEKDKLLMNKVRIDQIRIKRFLKQIEQGNVPPGQAQQFFYKLEKDLAIQDPKLRATRRLVQNWNDLSTQQQQLAATQIEKYYRINGMRSDMRPIFTKYAKSNGLIAGAGRMGKIATNVARKAGAFAIGYAAGRAAGV